MPKDGEGATDAQGESTQERVRLVLKAVESALEPACWPEAPLKRCLRSGGKSGAIPNSECRAAVASVVFGVSMLRARLGYMLAQCTGGAGGSLDVKPSAAMLALFLLHENHKQPGSRSKKVSEYLPISALGLQESALARLKTAKLLDVAAAADADPRPASADAGARPDTSVDAGARPDGRRGPHAPIPSLALHFSLPCALVRSWSRQLPTQADLHELLQCCNLPGPVWLRTNVAVAQREETRLALEAAGVRTLEASLSPWALQLCGERADWGGSVWSLPGWKEGAFEIQDVGSQLVVLACEARQGDVVLDLCAGNGGKTLALAALVGEEGIVLAHDVVEKRLGQLEASARRARVSSRIALLHPTAERLAASQIVSASASRAVNLALVDAPCSSSGVLRRHPGLRWAGHWNASSLRELAQLQLILLEQAASHVSAPGRLVYATCSLLEEENRLVALAFERGARANGWEPWPLPETFPGRLVDGVEPMAHLAQLWPHRHGTDGFFIARWRKQSAQLDGVPADDGVAGWKETNCIGGGGARHLAASRQLRARDGMGVPCVISARDMWEKKDPSVYSFESGAAPNGGSSGSIRGAAAAEATSRSPPPVYSMIAMPFAEDVGWDRPGHALLPPPSSAAAWHDSWQRRIEAWWAVTPYRDALRGCFGASQHALRVVYSRASRAVSASPASPDSPLSTPCFASTLTVSCTAQSTAGTLGVLLSRRFEQVLGMWRAASHESMAAPPPSTLEVEGCEWLDELVANDELDLPEFPDFGMQLKLIPHSLPPLPRLLPRHQEILGGRQAANNVATGDDLLFSRGGVAVGTGTALAMSTAVASFYFWQRHRKMAIRRQSCRPTLRKLRPSYN